MLKVERVSVMNLENAIRGARNPMNSWAKSDSYYDENGIEYKKEFEFALEEAEFEKIMAVIKADGKTTSEELATLRGFFAKNFGANAAEEAEEIIKELIKKDYNFHPIIFPLSNQSSKTIFQK